MPYFADRGTPLGQVYAATWFQTKVAVKYLTKEGGEAEKEFLNEIKVRVARLGSHFLVPFSRCPQRATARGLVCDVVILRRAPACSRRVLTCCAPRVGHVGVLPPEHRHLLLRLHGAAPGALNWIECACTLTSWQALFLLCLCSPLCGLITLPIIQIG